MPSTKTNRYSLWIVPKGTVGDKLQAMIDMLASKHNAPTFVPHLTLVAGIYAASYELNSVRQKLAELCRQVDSFTITLDGYGYMDEEFRCLYLLAHSQQLSAVYNKAAALFSQVDDQHFKAMPHLSLLYGFYTTEEKERILDKIPLSPPEFQVDSFDLFLTNDSASSWQLTEILPLN